MTRDRLLTHIDVATGHSITDDSDWQVLYGTLIGTPSASY